MTCSGERRVRLGEVIEMAQRYRGWSAELIPSTKIEDFLVELAGAQLTIVIFGEESGPSQKKNYRRMSILLRRNRVDPA